MSYGTVSNIVFKKNSFIRKKENEDEIKEINSIDKLFS